MASTSSPDHHTRTLPAAWTSQDHLDNITETLEALESYRKKDASKGWCRLHTAPIICSFPSVVVRFKAVGNAPIMRQNFYKITASNRFQAVIQFLRKELAWKSSDPLASLWIRRVYINSDSTRAFSSLISTSRFRLRQMILYQIYTKYETSMSCVYNSSCYSLVFLHGRPPDSQLQVSSFSPTFSMDTGNHIQHDGSMGLSPLYCV